MVESISKVILFEQHAYINYNYEIKETDRDFYPDGDVSVFVRVYKYSDGTIILEKCGTFLPKEFQQINTHEKEVLPDGISNYDAIRKGINLFDGMSAILSVASAILKEKEYYEKHLVSFRYERFD